MNKTQTRCFKSIKQLVTSTEQGLILDSTVDERFDDIFHDIIINHGIVRDHLPKDLPECVEHLTLVLPYAYVYQAPEGFDFNKGGYYLLDDLTSKYQFYHQYADDMILKDFSCNSHHNNLMELKLLGRAVYSWCQGGKFHVKRVTESHLPQGVYHIKLALIIAELYKELGSYSVLKADMSTPFVKDVYLDLVRATGNQKVSKGDKKRTRPDNKQESPIEEREME